MLKRSVLFSVLFLVLSSTSFAKGNIYTIKSKDFKADLKYLKMIGADIAGVDMDNGNIDVVSEVNPKMWDNNFEVIGQKKGFNAALDDAYKNPAEVTQIFKGFADAYPNLTKLHNLGTTPDNHTIWALEITNFSKGKASEKPSILFNSLHHAREVMTVEVAIDTAEYLLKNFSKSDEVKKWLNELDIWIVPMVNPDGSNFVWTKDNMWRKNTRGGYGVDINRNYPYKWNGCDGSSGDEYDQTYRGPAAASEMETQTIVKLVKNIRPVFNISYHSYSELVIYPYGCSGEKTLESDNVEKIGAELASKLIRDSGTGSYRPGTSWEILYDVDGGDIDFMYAEYKVIPFVIELNSTSQGFQPSFKKWRDKTVANTRPAWSYILNKATQKGLTLSAEFKEMHFDKKAQLRIVDLSKSNLEAIERKLDSKRASFIPLENGRYKITVTKGSKTVLEKTIKIDRANAKVKI